ncbi:LysR substrate-binding domain-containing protein [Vibrio mexicanus]|uniref:LysR substrate-binding domain-containing protein n=1 Tax=Vibrio mexicanus TaxID=1004326 RepID=UPI00063C3B91|nr:LysR substrate-binding domain-containing protein [Vibrio mexicanus]
MRLPLKSIHTFIAVAKTGSMTNAADGLNVSHSAISQAIKSLEEQLDLKLFVRVGRRVELTEIGSRYYQQVAPAMQQIIDATYALQVPVNENRLTFNMINSLAIHWWIPRVHQFHSVAPELDIRISNLVGVFELERENVDVAVIHGNKKDWTNYHCEKLSDDEMVLVCSPKLATRSSKPSELLAKYNAIYNTNDRRKNDWIFWCESKGLGMPNQQPNLTFMASVHALQAAINGLGVFVTHRQFVKDHVEQGLLVEVGEPVKHPFQDFYFACLPEKLKLASVEKLRRWLMSEFN